MANAVRMPRTNFAFQFMLAPWLVEVPTCTVSGAKIQRMSIPRRKLLGARNMQVETRNSLRSLRHFFANFAVKILLEVEKLNRKDREAIAKDAKKGLNHSGLVFLVFALEIGNTSVTLEVPNARRHFVNQILVMRDQQTRSLIAL